MTTRTDIHRPSAIEPADYDFVAIEHDRIAAFSPDVAYLVEVHRARIRAHMAKTGGTYSRHEHKGNCHVCGAHCIYTALFWHRATNVYIRTGFDCAEKMGAGDPAQFRVFRKALDAARHHKAGRRKAEGVLEQRGLTAAWKLYLRVVELPEVERLFVRAAKDAPGDKPTQLYYADWLEECGDEKRAAAIRLGHDVAFAGAPPHPEEERIVGDIVGKLIKYGSLSDRQYNFLGVLLSKITRRPEVEAKRAAEDSLKADVPEGRHTVEGEVIKVEARGERFRPADEVRHVMVVRADAGFALWGTIPSTLVGKVAKGSRVRLTATLERSAKDPKFGFFKRPIGELLSPEPAQREMFS